MNGTNSTDRRNYRSLIIAGTGTIGTSLVSLGADLFPLFDHIYALDRNEKALEPLQHSGVTCCCGDISDAGYVNTFLRQVSGPSLLVNLCAGTNNVRIRNSLAGHDTAYLDSCASMTDDPDECRFSRLMPYTYSSMKTGLPHWLCWGINPGLVEIIARRMLATLTEKTCGYDVTVYEFDRLTGPDNQDKAAVGWCPEALIEEVMLAPTMVLENGIPLEESGVGTRYCTVNWGSQAIPARVVGHEDIWNLADIPAVRNGRFYYGLSPAVMEILAMDDPKRARDMLYIPRHGQEITGLEQVAVQVDGSTMAAPRTMVWTEDHSVTWKQFGVNAVQYQTAKSLLLAIMLLQRTDYGFLPLSCSASNLPISSRQWPLFEQFMEELDINWQDGAALNLHPLQE